MHRKQEANLLSLNTEIERTIKTMRKIIIAKSISISKRKTVGYSKRRRRRSKENSEA